ncbi:hypothetical protein OPT61_g5409 [Boeremia exigua]|uniref:Uncharacterized protein n=1 Tax=Boeremia exigua TaxID=749465 RepID=A0ACC2IAM8_9PLEO|nr:hypothetical protein OPT61_g5409 [Boeremia exigua]
MFTSRCSYDARQFSEVYTPLKHDAMAEIIPLYCQVKSRRKILMQALPPITDDPCATLANPARASYTAVNSSLLCVVDLSLDAQCVEPRSRCECDAQRSHFIKTLITFMRRMDICYTVFLHASGGIRLSHPLPLASLQLSDTAIRTIVRSSHMAATHWDRSQGERGIWQARAQRISLTHQRYCFPLTAHTGQLLKLFNRSTRPDTACRYRPSPEGATCCHSLINHEFASLAVSYRARISREFPMSSPAPGPAVHVIGGTTFRIESTTPADKRTALALQIRNNTNACRCKRPTSSRTRSRDLMHAKRSRLALCPKLQEPDD